MYISELKGGVNYSNIKGDYGKDFETAFKFGVHSGLFVDFKSANAFSFQTELNFSQKGCKYSNPSGVQHLYYIDVPFLFKFTFREGGGFHFGPQISFLAGAAYKEAGYVDNSTEGINTSNFSLCFGIHEKLGTKMEIGARYNYGLSKVMEASSPFTTLTSPDRVFQLYIAFKIKGKDQPVQIKIPN